MDSSHVDLSLGGRAAYICRSRYTRRTLRDDTLSGNVAVHRSFDADPDHYACADPDGVASRDPLGEHHRPDIAGSIQSRRIFWIRWFL